MMVWFCLFPLPLGVWEGLRFVIVALPGLFSYLFFAGGVHGMQPLAPFACTPIYGYDNRISLHVM